MRLAFAAVVILLLPQTQDATVPTGAQPLHTAEGRGVQIYRCDQQKGSFQWALQGPEAKLLDPSTHQQVGTHGAGPTWTWKDGSAVAGTVMQKLPSPEPTSIPWLLLAAKPVAGRTGALSNVTWVRRSETHGGNPPASGCDQEHQGAMVRVPYEATYTFYTGASGPSPSGAQQ
jgi:hypothetical protein